MAGWLTLCVHHRFVHHHFELLVHLHPASGEVVATLNVLVNISLTVLESHVLQLEGGQLRPHQEPLDTGGGCYHAHSFTFQCLPLSGEAVGWEG